MKGLMNLLTHVQTLPDLARQGILLAAIAFALFMAMIPHRYDPFRFINDKVKHAITFVVLLIKTATSATFVVMIQGSSCLYADPKYNTPP